MKLRNYQKDALNAVASHYKQSLHRQLIVLPTGTGKTVIIAGMSKRFRRKTLILAHREELIQQTKSKILQYWPNADIGIYKAKRNELDHKIVIGSVQTCLQSKRLKQLKKKGFSLLIIDEAHHAPASSYKKVIKALGFMDNKKKLLVGLTATPKRNDKKNLSTVFQKIVFSRSISEMINKSFLSPVVGRKITTDVSLTGIKSYNGDFSAKSLAQAINIPERNELIAVKYKQHALKRKGIAFCVNVKHCHELAQTFRSLGINSEAVWGEMPPEQRKAALEDFQKGKVQVLTSCGILTEGYDESSIECIVMARTTKSKSLYIQCVGRGLRTHKGKTNCLVLDFADSYHNLQTLMSLETTIPEAEILGNNSKRSYFPQKTKTVIETKITEIHDEQFDLLNNNRFIWIPLDNNEFSLSDDDGNEFVVRPQNNSFVADFYEKRSGKLCSTPEMTIEDCFSFCEQFALKKLNMVYGDPYGRWMKSSCTQQATLMQMKLLTKKGYRCNKFNKAQASIEIRRLIAESNQQKRIQQHIAR